jgi:hypothetical protein
LHCVSCYVTRSSSVLTTIAIATPLTPHATTILDLNSDNDALGRGRVFLLYCIVVVSSLPSRLGSGHVPVSETFEYGRRLSQTLINLVLGWV